MTTTKMLECLQEICFWMNSSWHKMSLGKTKAMLVGKGKHIEELAYTLALSSCEGIQSPFGKVIGSCRVLFDFLWSFDDQIDSFPKMPPFTSSLIRNIVPFSLDLLPPGWVTVTQCIWSWMWRWCTASSWYRMWLPTFSMAQADTNTLGLFSSSSTDSQSCSNGSLRL